MSETGAVLLDTDGAAKVLCVSRYTVRKWTREGRLPVTRIGGAVRFDRGALLRFIEASTSKPVTPLKQPAGHVA